MPMDTHTALWSVMIQQGIKRQKYWCPKLQQSSLTKKERTQAAQARRHFPFGRKNRTKPRAHSRSDSHLFHRFVWWTSKMQRCSNSRSVACSNQAFECQWWWCACWRSCMLALALTTCTRIYFAIFCELPSLSISTTHYKCYL